MPYKVIKIDDSDPEVKKISSDKIKVSDLGEAWTKGQMDTDFPSIFEVREIAAIIRQPEGTKKIGPPKLWESKTFIEVNKDWEVDVRWEVTVKSSLSCFIKGYWGVKVFFESLGDDELDREAKYPIQIDFDRRKDSYHAQFKIRAFDPDDPGDPDDPNDPVVGLEVEPDEGTPFEVTVAVVFMAQCAGEEKARPGPIIGKVNFPIIQAFTEEVQEEEEED